MGHEWDPMATSLVLSHRQISKWCSWVWHHGFTLPSVLLGNRFKEILAQRWSGNLIVIAPDYTTYIYCIGVEKTNCLIKTDCVRRSRDQNIADSAIHQPTFSGRRDKIILWLGWFTNESTFNRTTKLFEIIFLYLNTFENSDVCIVINSTKSKQRADL